MIRVGDRGEFGKWLNKQADSSRRKFYDLYENNLSYSDRLDDDARNIIFCIKLIMKILKNLWNLF